MSVRMADKLPGRTVSAASEPATVTLSTLGWTEAMTVSDRAAPTDRGAMRPLVFSAGPVRFSVNQLPGLGDLSRNLWIRLYEEEGVTFAECDELEAVESGDDFGRALDNLVEFIAADYAHWADARESDLTPQAQALRQKYVSLRR